MHITRSTERRVPAELEQPKPQQCTKQFADAKRLEIRFPHKCTAEASAELIIERSRRWKKKLIRL